MESEAFTSLALSLLMKKALFATILLAATFPQLAGAMAFIDLTPSAYAEDIGVASVVVRYRETGKLLALVPVTFEVMAQAESSGEIELDYPWYSFITVDKKNKLESELKVAVDGALRKLSLGSVKAEGETVRGNFTPTEADAVSQAMRQVLEDNFGPGAQEETVD